MKLSHVCLAALIACIRGMGIVATKIAIEHLFIFGGPLWLLLAAWIWHKLAALSASNDIKPSPSTSGNRNA